MLLWLGGCWFNCWANRTDLTPRIMFFFIHIQIWIGTAVVSCYRSKFEKTLIHLHTKSCGTYRSFLGSRPSSTPSLPCLNSAALQFMSLLWDGTPSLNVATISLWTSYAVETEVADDIKYTSSLRHCLQSMPTLYRVQRQEEKKKWILRYIRLHTKSKTFFKY